VRVFRESVLCAIILVQSQTEANDEVLVSKNKSMGWPKTKAKEITAAPKQQRETWEAEEQNIAKTLLAFDEDPEWRSEARKTWKKLGGKKLESAFRGANPPIALLDAQWLVNFALRKTKRDGKSPILPYRQKLPPEAFLSCEELIASTTKKSMPILALSYCWLSPEHPDPKGTTLQLVAKKCQQMLLDKDKSSFPRFGVFWDYASLYQHPKPSKKRFRTKDESKLFEQGLQSLHLVYSHPYCRLLKVFKYPRIKANGGTARINYNDRGWPLVEDAWSRLTPTKWTRVDDLGQVKVAGGAIEPPLTPARLGARLEQAAFSNVEDMPLVMKLYKDSFVRHFESVHQLDYCAARWGDIQITQLADIVRGGYLKAVKEFDLSGNYFGPSGCKALVDSFSSRKSGCHPTILRLGDNCRISSTGIKELARLIVKVEDISIRKCGVGYAGCQALAEAAEKASPNVRLRRISLSENPIGSTGAGILASLLVHCLVVDLSHCDICNSGCKTLADVACTMVHDSPLEELDLSGNEGIDDEGAVHIGQLVRHCPKLRRLVLDKRLLLKNKGTMTLQASNPHLEVKWSSNSSFSARVSRRRKRRVAAPISNV